MIFKTDGKGTDLNGFLDRGSFVQGELSFETTFRIDGRFSGSVKSKGDLIVGEAGEIEGQIEVGQVFISGTVRGTVLANKKVEITPTGKVFADLTTPSLIIGNGAHFEGRCSMTLGNARDAARDSAPAREAAPAKDAAATPPEKAQAADSGSRPPAPAKGSRRGEASSEAS